jgi:cell fate (sporulation/competence/biofilm development) regulator YlbF (YheA/YmcA/DUF963 family)
MKLQEHIDEIMRQGFSPDEIRRAVDRIENLQTMMDMKLDMVQFASRLCRMDEVDNADI